MNPYRYIIVNRPLGFTPLYSTNFTYQNKYILFKKPCKEIWYFDTKRYNKEISQKIEDAMNGITDNLNSYNIDKNIFDLLYHCNHKTVVHIINLKEKSVLDMSTMKKYILNK